MEKKRSVLVMLGWNDPRFVAGVGRYARKKSWHLALRYLFERALPLDWEGDGVLVSQSEAPGFNDCVSSLIRRHPAVGVGCGIPEAGIPIVDTDHAVDGKQAARYFLELGHRNFAWFSATPGPVADIRCAAFRETVEEVGHSCTLLGQAPVQGGQRDTWKGRQAWLKERLLELPKPMALFAGDDLQAVEVIEACIEAGIRVPEDVAVLGVGNMELPCECSQVPLSSIEYDFEGMGYAAAGMLEQLMDGNAPSNPRLVIRPTRLVTRQSTSSLAVDDPRLLNAIRFMHANLARDIGIDDIAAGSAVPVRTLQLLFKENFRRGPAQFLLLMRLDQACEMLLETAEPIQAIAEACGLKSPRNINRCFHRELGIPPRAYRQSRPVFVPLVPPIDW